MYNMCCNPSHLTMRCAGVASQVRLMELINAKRLERGGSARDVNGKGTAYDQWYFGAGRPALERLMSNFASNELCPLQEVDVK